MARYLSERAKVARAKRFQLADPREFDGKRLGALHKVSDGAPVGPQGQINQGDAKPKGSPGFGEKKASLAKGFKALNFNPRSTETPSVIRITPKDGGSAVCRYGRWIGADGYSAKRGTRGSRRISRQECGCGRCEVLDRALGLGAEMKALKTENERLKSARPATRKELEKAAKRLKKGPERDAILATLNEMRPAKDDVRKYPTSGRAHTPLGPRPADSEIVVTQVSTRDFTRWIGTGSATED